MPSTTDELENAIKQYVEKLLYDKNHENSSNGSVNTAPKLDISQPEPFPKPTPIPPIGNDLLTSSPTQAIQPIASAIKKQPSFGPIKDELIDSEKISKIEDIPKLDGISTSMEKEFKRYRILAHNNTAISIKDLYKRAVSERLQMTISLLKKLRILRKNRQNFANKSKRKAPIFAAQISKESDIRGLKHRVKRIILGESFISKPTVSSIDKRNIKKQLFSKRTFQDTRLGRVRKLMLTGSKRVAIPSPPPLEMQPLEPFKKEKDIENISKISITLKDPQPIGAIDKHLIQVDKQKVIEPLSNHVIDHEDIQPLQQIANLRLVK